MAAHARYPPPHEQLLILAQRARSAGLPFDVFWERAIRPGQPPVTWANPPEERPEDCVVWPRDTTDRNISIAAAKGARAGWKRSYDGEPPERAEAALLTLRPALDAAERATAEAVQQDAEARTTAAA